MTQGATSWDRGGGPGRRQGPTADASASRGAGETARNHHVQARAAQRHSLFVALMKGLLPSLAVGLVIVFVFYSRGGFAPDLPDDLDFDPGQIDVASDGIRMVNPKLSGTDDRNQRFEVSAASATQDRNNPALVTLDQINAEMQLADGGWVRVDARGGTFDSDRSLLTLEQQIEVTMSSGYVARLDGASVDFEKGTLVTANPVLVFMNAGIITGNAMEILDRGKFVRFTNRASMTINGNVAENGR